MLEFKQSKAETGSAERSVVPRACELATCLMILIVVLGSPCAWGELTPQELIERWSNGQAAMTSRAVQSTMAESYRKSQAEQFRFARRDAKYYTDGQRLKRRRLVLERIMGVGATHLNSD